MSMTRQRPLSTLRSECNRPDACAASNTSAIPSYKECDAFIEVAAASQKTQHLPTCSCVTDCHLNLSTQPMLPMIWHLLLSLFSRGGYHVVHCDCRLSLIDSCACPCSAKAGASQRFVWACHQQRAQGAVLLSVWDWSQA